MDIKKNKRNLRYNFFAYGLGKLKSLIENLEIEDDGVEELLTVDFDEYFLGNQVVFAVFTDEDVAIYWSLINVASSCDYVNDKCAALIVDDLKLVLFEIGEYVFIFSSEKEIEQAENMVETLL